MRGLQCPSVAAFNLKASIQQVPVVKRRGSSQSHPQLQGQSSSNKEWHKALWLQVRNKISSRVQWDNFVFLLSRNKERRKRKQSTSKQITMEQKLKEKKNFKPLHLLSGCNGNSSRVLSPSSLHDLLSSSSSSSKVSNPQLLHFLLYGLSSSLSNSPYNIWINIWIPHSLRKQKL